MKKESKCLYKNARQPNIAQFSKVLNTRKFKVKIHKSFSALFKQDRFETKDV